MKSKTYKIFLLILIFLSVKSEAQQITWQRILNSNPGMFYKTQQLNDGNYIAVGTTFSNGADKIILEKFNQAGDTIWKRIIGTDQSANYNGFWVEQTKDFGYIITGEGPVASGDAYLIKTDSLGMIQWQKHFGGGGLDQGYCVKQTFDNGYILSIRTTSYSPNDLIMMVKTDSIGNLVWQNLYNYGENNYAQEIRLIKNYGYIVAGAAGQIGQNGFVYLLRLNLIGDTIWTKKYAGDNFSAGYSIDTTSDKGFIIGGNTRPQFYSDQKSYVIKTDSSGLIQWQKSFSGIDGEEDCKSVRVIPNRGYVISGISDTPYIPFSVSGFIRILNFSGDVISQKYYNPGTDDDVFNSVENTNDGGFILSGVSIMRHQPYNLYIVKTDSLGYAQPPVGIQNNLQFIPGAFELFQNYPNPFNPSTNISFIISKYTFVRLRIYDILGKEVKVLISENRQAGYYNVSFDGTNFPSGIYYYKLEAGDFVQVKKMVLIR